MPVKEQPAPDLGYRPAITGLRAVAVMGVLLYHLKFNAFHGGFVGVDIFFVISGYLITRQILENAAGHKFSFLEFYARRMSRILPALIFTIVVTFVVGMLWLPPEFLRSLAKESNHALLTVANIQYWREAKLYFAPSANDLGLLHCWSLSLEEQFYLVWPVFILMSVRFLSPAVTIGVAALCSFALAAFWSGRDAQAVFFLMPFRIFEFAIGALVIFAEKRSTLSKSAADIMFCAGLLTIGFSIACLDSGWRYLGCAVLAPCLGAAAIIRSGDVSRLSFLLTNRVCIGIGLISYSLYLCHWPILFFARYIFAEGADSAASTAVIAMATFAIGAAMYRFVEQPFRYRRSQSGGDLHVIRNYVSIVAVLLAVGFTAFLQNGWTWRLSRSQIEATDLQRIGMEPCARFGHRRCAFGELDRPVGLEIIGDSHAWNYVAGLDPILKEFHLRGETPTLGGCLMLAGIRLTNEWTDECLLIRNELFDRLRKTETPVFLSQYWQFYDSDIITPENPALHPPGESAIALLQRGIEDTVTDIGKNGRRIMLIGAQVLNECNIHRARVLPGPLWHAPLPPCTGDTKAQAVAKGARINEMLRAVQAKWPRQITLLLPVDYMCDDTCNVVSDGTWLYRDKGHLTVAGSRYFAMRARDALTEFLNPASRSGG